MPYADVIAAGAVGDGLHDDTCAFESALATLASGAILRVPGRLYLLCDTLHIDRPLRIVGDGAFVGAAFDRPDPATSQLTDNVIRTLHANGSVLGGAVLWYDGPSTRPALDATAPLDVQDVALAATAGNTAAGIEVHPTPTARTVRGGTWRNVSILGFGTNLSFDSVVGGFFENVRSVASGKTGIELAGNGASNFFITTQITRFTGTGLSIANGTANHFTSLKVENQVAGPASAGVSISGGTHSVLEEVSLSGPWKGSAVSVTGGMSHVLRRVLLLRDPAEISVTGAKATKLIDVVGPACHASLSPGTVAIDWLCPEPK